ncbi:hypothetical protein [Vibrio hannami]
MGILIIITAVALARLLEAKAGFTYNIFSDPFDFKLAMIDLALFFSIYVGLSVAYAKIKQVVTRIKSKRT